MTKAMTKQSDDRQATEAKINALLRRADQGDARATSDLRELFAGVPAIWHELGDVASQAERSLIAATAGKNAVIREATSRKLAAMRRELAGPTPSPLERLLVDRIVVCWLALASCEAVYYQNLKDLTMTQGDYHQRRIDRAHRRYLSAIRALAQVRRLELPSMQVNIGEKQVNILQAPNHRGGE